LTRIFGSSNPLYLDSGTVGRIETGGISFDVVDDFIAKHETIGIITIIWEARKATETIGRNQTKSIPSIPPSVPNLASVENEMFLSRLGKMPTDREARLPSANDNRVQKRIHRQHTPSQAV
jgi:hypothetical protein